MNERQTKLMEEYKSECREIALQCRAEGYPDRGENYELRCEELWERDYADEFDDEDKTEEEDYGFND